MSARFRLTDTETLDALEEHIRWKAVRAGERGDGADPCRDVLEFLAGLTDDKRGVKPGEPVTPTRQGKKRGDDQ